MVPGNKLLCLLLSAKSRVLSTHFIIFSTGFSQTLIITNKDLRLMNVKDLPPVMLQTTAGRYYKYAVRLYRAVKKPHMYFEYATRIYHWIRQKVS